MTAPHIFRSSLVEARVKLIKELFYLLIIKIERRRDMFFKHTEIHTLTSCPISGRFDHIVTYQPICKNYFKGSIMKVSMSDSIMRNIVIRLHRRIG